ncbi:hypothetical protein BH23BAC1_BH23BAC1_09240 [soil metagenome]
MYFKNHYFIRNNLKRSLILVIVLFLAIVGAGGYVYYHYWFKSSKVEVWSLIPGNAIAVYESKNTIENWNTLQQKELWTTLASLPSFQNINQSLSSLDSISGKAGDLDKLLKSNPLYISVHKTSKESLGYLFYIEILDLEKYSIANQLIKAFRLDTQLKTDTRTYHGEIITELKNSKLGKTFSYIIYKDHFVGSFYPVLVEDVIRNLEVEEHPSFKDQNASLFTINSNSFDEENLYINQEKLKDFLSVFTEPGGLNKEIYNSFSRSSRLSLDFKDNYLSLNGYTIPGEGEFGFYLQTFKDQSPQPIEVENLVPNRTATFLHYTFENGLDWYKNLIFYWQKKDPSQIKKSEELKNKFSLEPSKYFKWMAGEIGLATLASVEPRNPDKLLFIKTNDINEAANQLKKLTAAAEGSVQDSIYSEIFADISIYLLNIQEFPSKLLGDNFTGFPLTYYAFTGNYLVMGNSSQVIKSMLADREADNTWGKSVALTEFRENYISDANISYIVNTDRAWNLLLANLNSSWKKYFNTQVSHYKNLKLLSLQLTNTGDRFYTSIVLNNEASYKQEKNLKNFQLASNLSVDAPIITKPFFIKKAGGKTSEVIFQDSLFNIYKVSLDGSIIWKDSIGEAIVGGIHEVNFNKDSQKNYVFTTTTAFHVLSIDGEYVPGFPHQLNTEVEFMSVIDYDQSKNYRFLISSHKGELYMLDRDMAMLEGWRPRNLNFKPSAAPSHLRIRGKDCIISLQENGFLHVMNRRGELYHGFPVDLQGIYKNPVFIETGPTFAQTILTTISDKGEFIKLNLEGKLIRREQLYRPSKETKFTLCIDEFKKDYIIARQEQGILTLLDKRGEVILEKDYITSGILDIQYFNTGFEKQIYAVTDKIQEFTYLYDHSGTLINFRPIESGHEVELTYSEPGEKYEVMANYDSKFSVINFTK